MKTSPFKAGFIPALCFAVISCSDALFEMAHIELSRYSATYGVRKDSVIVQKDTVPPVALACAVDFPPGYDWQKDSLFGTEEGFLRLYRDGQLYKSIPTGPGTETGTDADGHFFFGEDFYSIFREKGVIVIKKNGTEMLRYSSQEVIRGFLPDRGSIWTLGQTSEEICLRQNGVPVFSRKGGSIYGETGDVATQPGGALYKDSGELCFSYSKNGVWYIVRDSEEAPVLSDGMLDTILGVRSIGGITYMLGSRVGDAGPFIYRNGGDRRRMFYYCLDPQTNFKLFEDGGEVYFCGTYHERTADRDITEVWNVSNQQLKLRTEQCYVYAVKNGLAYVVPDYSGDSTGEVCLLLHYGKAGDIRMEGRHYFPGSRCAAYSESSGTLLLGLSPYRGKPAVWMNGRSTVLDVNGYISAVSLVQPSE